MSGHLGQKTALRRRLLAVRSAHGALSDAAHAVCARLLDLPALQPAMTVLGYAASPREVSVDDALRAWQEAGRTVCLPWVDGLRLRIGAVEDLSTGLRPGWKGIREPATPRREVPAEELDALVVPGLGFDAAGRRLGYGGGHFDRLLTTIRADAVTVGVALDEQVVDRVPTEPHDRRVDWLVTPTRTLRCG